MKSQKVLTKSVRWFSDMPVYSWVFFKPNSCFLAGGLSLPLTAVCHSGYPCASGFSLWIPVNLPLGFALLHSLFKLGLGQVCKRWSDSWESHSCPQTNRACRIHPEGLNSSPQRELLSSQSTASISRSPPFFCYSNFCKMHQSTATYK